MSLNVLAPVHFKCVVPHKNISVCVVVFPRHEHLSLVMAAGDAWVVLARLYYEQ